VAGAELIYYWDTCLFLAWIKDEERKSGEMDGVREIIERSKSRSRKLGFRNNELAWSSVGA
jgi:hypothetical protein